MKDWLFDKFVAHRGLHGADCHENTLDAFRRAADNGYNIELDVQPTADGVPVIFHDTHLKRLTGRNCYVREITYKDLRDNVRYRDGSTLPTFEEALKVCEGRTGIMIEVKKDDYLTPDTDIEQIILPILESYRGDFIVKSFNPHSVTYMRQHAPQFRAGLLCDLGTVESYSIHVRALVDELLFGKNKVDFFDVAVGLLETPLACTLREQGMPIITWTVRDQATYEAKRHLFDNMIFENFIPKRV